jgi:hypothetical protein
VNALWVFLILLALFLRGAHLVKAALDRQFPIPARPKGSTR